MALIEKSVGRRDFLKGGIAALAGAAALGAAGCSEPQQLGSTGSTEGDDGEHTAHVVESDTAILEGKGEWRPLTCYEHCGGNCINKGYMVDGIIVRQSNDDTFEDTDTMPQTRGCIRGRSLRQQFYNVDRLKYPMKRKHWQPGGGENAHGELRGKDEWERITWEEALDYVADEIMRVERDYGPRSVFNNAWWWFQGVNVLYAAGGCVTMDDTESWGTWGQNINLLGLDLNPFLTNSLPHLLSANSFSDLKNADYIVLYSYNLGWTIGNQLNFLRRMANFENIQFVSVGPANNVTAQLLGAKWIPVRCGTDTAFQLAVMYEMMRLDEEQGNVIDWDYLAKYTVGFDMDHMPEDAQLQECISGYVRGEYDGTPKTPEWASEICGTPVEDITWYAQMMSKQNKVSLYHGYASARCSGAENLPQAMLTVQCMGGHMGSEGNCFAGPFASLGMGSNNIVSAGSARTNPLMENPVGKNFAIHGPLLWDSLKNGKFMCYNDDYFANHDTAEVNAHEGTEEECHPRIMFQHQANLLQTRQNLNEGIEVMRMADLCVAMDIKTTLTAQYSDIILPCSTAWEFNDDPDDGPVQWPCSNFGGTVGTAVNALRANIPLTKPVYECRDDLWIYRELVSRFGVDPDEVYPVSSKTSYFDSLLNSTVRDLETGEAKPIINWTEEQSAEWGIDNPAQEGLIEFDQFFKDGKYQPDYDWQNMPSVIAYADYMADPEANPLGSRSGKWELYCQLKADTFNIMGYNPDPIKPYANYIVPVQGYEESFKDWATKEKGDYPLQVYTPHYQRRAHTCYDNLRWTQEAFVNPVFMNADDAAERGIADGDTVIIRSPYGRVLRRAQTMQSMMPGQVGLPHGPHSRMDESYEEGPLDLGGSEQSLYGPVRSNYMPNVDNYNTLLVEIEKWSGDELPWDYEAEPFTAGTVVE